MKATVVRTSRNGTMLHGGKARQRNVRAYSPMRRRSSSIRNIGGRSSLCRSRYSAISSSAFRVGAASTLAKKRRHTEKSPRLTAGASRDEEEAGMALSVSPNFDRYNHIAGFTLMM